ncbi:MAG: TonB family protein [Acidobacteria bacterium]|nr:TonB family protein [Acidobacteriota bacterium]
MFTPLEPHNPRGWLCVIASGLGHCLLVYVWISRPPIFVKTSSVAWGQHGRSLNLVYFPRASEPPAQQKRTRLELKSNPKKSERRSDAVPEAARVGAPTGSAFEGRNAGTEAKPAIPVVFPDPQIYPWQLPTGFNGDVVVEITIDQQGKVTETRLLQSLKREIDDEVLAAVRSWRFMPATVDGVAISSRQDVHFHFPS